LTGLDDEVRRVRAEVEGELYAAMVDTGKSFDALMRRVGGDQAAVERIFANRVYQSFSRTLARSHAYVAMERLYDAVEGAEYDLVVLDTPPLRSALDILDAPGRLVRLLDEDAIRWLLRPARGPLSRLLPSGGAAAARLLGLVAGKRLVEETSAFFSVLFHLQEGFRERSERVGQMLREPSTAFLLVCSPSHTSLEDAAFLRDGLGTRGVELDAVIYNRAFVPEASDPRLPLAARPIAADVRLEPLRSELQQLRRTVAEENLGRERAIATFAARVPARCASAVLPELERDVRDVEGLLFLASLVQSSAGA
jgi:anion-transporting  ArsA/GET3 family ATPase